MPRPPLTEEQKQVLRDRLAEARAKKAAMPKTPRPPRVRLPKPTGPPPVYAVWTENHWMTSPIDICKQRLALLKQDFECGARIVGQRSDANDPRSYSCFVCHNPVAEVNPSGRGPGWVWKHDYLNPATGLYESVVICNQHCHTVYVNDVRLQQKLKDLIRGAVSAPEAAA